LDGRDLARVQVALRGAGPLELLARGIVTSAAPLAAGFTLGAPLHHGHGRVGERRLLRDPDPRRAKDVAARAAGGGAARRVGAPRNRAANRAAACETRDPLRDPAQYDPLVSDLHRGVRPHPRRTAGFTLEHYRALASGGGMGRFAINSLIVTGIAVPLQILLSAAAGHALARGRFAGKGVTLGLATAFLILPRQVTLVPLYLLF